MPKGKILIIAGSDSGGGAGIQADIKTVTMLDGYAMTAITALTSQNTQGVHGVHPIPPATIGEQIRVTATDLPPDAVKTGMLHSAAVIRTVVSHRSFFNGAPLVVDPVMVAKGGQSLLEQDAIKALQEELLPHAALVTPNVPEAELLSGTLISSEQGMINAGQEIRRRTGCGAVLVKGGHLDGPESVDILVDASGIHRFASRRIVTRHTHGTGCTLASAIATMLAQGQAMAKAVEQARDYVQHAIASAPGFGHGHGPLNHSWRIGSS